jgi:hypothetical protein
VAEAEAVAETEAGAATGCTCAAGTATSNVAPYAAPTSNRCSAVNFHSPVAHRYTLTRRADAHATVIQRDEEKADDEDDDEEGGTVAITDTECIGSAAEAVAGDAAEAAPAAAPVKSGSRSVHSSALLSVSTTCNSPFELPLKAKRPSAVDAQLCRAQLAFKHKEIHDQ